MKKFYIVTLAALIMTSSYVFGQSAAKHQQDAERAKLVNTRVDNNGYWKRKAALGLAKLNPVKPVKPAVYTGSEIRAFSVLTEDSPDIPVAVEGGSTQSENSIFVNPQDNQIVVNSNNSTQNPVGDLYGSNSIETYDGGQTWDGDVEGAGGYNSGDPVALVGLDGAYYIGAISNPGGQLIAKSVNQGTTYTSYTVAPNPGELADKNHLWIDNSPISPYSNNLYDAWTAFGGSNNNDIVLSRSTNGGTVWSSPVNVSSAVNAGSHCQGVNINSGPGGEVYVIWAIYDGWPTDESAIGMARSFDGGATFESGTRIISNIRGIRNTGVNKDMRNNSFPSMAVDISNGEYSGNIYIVWSNVGVPGINSGNDVDVYIARSEDLGVTWSTPVKVNQDQSGLGRKHYFPWITCDPANGILSVIFYDDRNVGGNQCEVYCANSYDGGETWEDFKVSDVSFTPGPIPGLAGGYMGDYLGINANGGLVYPVWADNRTGSVMSYCSPYETNPLSKPTGLTASVPFETGITELEWAFNEAPLFSYFKIYRGLDSIGIAYDTVYNDQLPDYGVYTYKVTAKYSDGNESSASTASVQWGDAQISVNPSEIEETLMPDSSVTRLVTISNIGQLEMNYNISMIIPTDTKSDPKAYCAASGGCDEYIMRVQLNEIDNLSDCNGYENFTSLSTVMSVGDSYQITVINGNTTYPDDQCGLWIDWNQNEEFEENEEVPMNGTPGVGPYTATITPPVGAVAGETRLRTRITYYQTPTPCGAHSWGEVEDYTVSILSWLTADPVSGTVQAGENLDINVNLSAVDMALGTYTAELSVYSNDPDDPEIVVPITLHVAEVAVNLTADDEEVCLGETVHITSAMTGGSGTFTYTWTSDPVGFTSSEPNITVTPEVTTTYFCEVFDGTITVSDQIMIQVDPLPSVYIGADTTICLGETVTFDAGAGFAGYLWSTGETTQTIQASTSGEYSVTVTNEFECTAYDALTLAVVLNPEKPVITNGPATVDNYEPASTIYTSGVSANADSYVWAVSPVEAGTTTSTGTSAEFFWTAGYTGSVLVTVTAMNDCFTSEVSDAFSTTIYTSVGLNENTAEKQLIIYPNPSDGKIAVRLPSQKSFTGDLTVTDANGATVMTKTSMTILSGDVATLDLGQLSEGVYSVKLSSLSQVYFGKVIIK
jgi:hypothetical protein